MSNNIMSNNLLVAGIVAIIYFIFKFIEMRFISKENKPLKQIIIDTGVVFVSAIVANFAIEKMDLKKAKFNEAPAFTDGPGF